MWIFNALLVNIRLYDVLLNAFSNALMKMNEMKWIGYLTSRLASNVTIPCDHILTTLFFFLVNQAK